MSTSISDKSSYLQICEAASLDDAIFNIFKRHPSYNEILEHVSYEQGEAYLQHIKEIPADILNRFVTNDLIGSPFTYFYPQINRRISPTTLRYIKIVQDLNNLFGDLSKLSIVEIGGGYGGQCKIIHDLFKPLHYTIFDLSEPSMLTDKYLKMHQIQNYTLLNSIEVVESDLLISNYAFTECFRDIQTEYLEKVITRAKHGYMILNKIDPSLNPYSYEELKEKVKGKLLDEIPSTHPNNKLLVW